MTTRLSSIVMIGILILSLIGCAGAPATTPLPERPTASATPIQPSPKPTIAEATPTTVNPTPTPATKAAVSEETMRSDVERVTSPNVAPTQVEQQVVGNNAFGFELYHATGEEKDGNLFYSPHSLSLALAMAYAGARGETQTQMAETLHYVLPQEDLHPTLNSLDLTLSQRGQKSDEEQGQAFELNIANAIWGQAGYAFLPDYLDLLARNYGAGLRTVDFQTAYEQARQTINEWVAQETEGKIDELLAKGSLNELTRLALTNAIYFKASWKYPFDEKMTQDGPFHTLDGKEITVPMMRQTELFGYHSEKGFQAIELPYVGEEMSMVILLPNEGAFKEFEAWLDAEQISKITEELEQTNVALTMPRFEFDSSLSLAGTLSDMGMPNAFSGEKANFSGMDGTKELYITDVLHKAYVSVNEAGTEAAAATAVVVGITSAPAETKQVTLDRPFVFLIRDVETGAILFMGRVVNPKA